MRPGQVAAVFLVLATVLVLCLTSFPTARAVKQAPPFSLLPHSIRVEHHLVDSHPDLVLETHTPAFDWQLSDEYRKESGELVPMRGITQTAYRIRVSRAGKTLWDTQKVASSQSVQLVYSGPGFASDTTYSFAIMYWSSTGAVSDWARGSFRTALFSPADWSGVWIGSDALNMNQLRKAFTLPAAAQRATVFYCGLGYSELYLDGSKVDESRVLDPGWTQYYRRSLYVSFDLTAKLGQGDHVLGIRLGDGWYTREPVWVLPSNVTYGPPRVILQLNVVLTDGSNVTVVSGTDWEGQASHTIGSGIYQGEVTDKRMLQLDWSSPSYKPQHTHWEAAQAMPSPLGWGGVLSLQMMDPIRKGEDALHIRTSSSNALSSSPRLVRARIGADITQRVLRPIAQNNNVYDIGQNMVGFALINQSFIRGVSVYVRYAEYKMLQQDLGPFGTSDTGNIDQSDLHSIAVEDVYFVNGGGQELLEPSFTYRGFRFLSILANDAVDAASISCPVVHSEGSLVGNFSTDNPVIAQTVQNILWTQIGNTMSVMTDCPQRNERRGWMGDASSSSDLSMFNFDFANLYRNYIQLIEDDQDPSGAVHNVAPNSCCDSGAISADPNWGTAFATITYNLYDHYADTATMSKHYDSIARLFEGVYSGWYEQHGLKEFFGPFYDWIPQPDGVTDNSLVSSFAWMQDCYHLAEMGALLNRTADAQHYNDTYYKLVQEFNNVWFHSDSNSYANNAQTANALALALPGVVPDSLRPAVAKNLVADISSKGHFTSGIIGLSQLFIMLSSTGHHDVAVKLASSTDYPSSAKQQRAPLLKASPLRSVQLTHLCCARVVDSYGWTQNNPFENATTIWETFNAALDGGGASHQHHMFSAGIGSWVWRSVAGIHPNGLQAMLIHPRLQHNHSLLSSVNAETLTSKGRVAVAWESDWALQQLAMNVSLPPNAQAKLVVETPVKGGRWSRLSLNGQWLLNRQSAAVGSEAVLDGVRAWRETADGAVELEAMSGGYEFVGVWE